MNRTTMLSLLVVSLMPVHSAYATMPSLTSEPSQATLETCRQWAKEQSEDAFDTWGVQENGGSSNEIGIMRLTLSCLGDDIPGVVAATSSAGAHQIYCSKHRAAASCK